MTPKDTYETDVLPATPVRSLGAEDPRGFRLLRDVGSTYRDGAEEILLEIIQQARDVSSDSDELIGHARNWAQRYHLDPARANVVRALDLPADARVLEIGAGCGAITRYVGEQCAVVDALEPVPARAAVAAARTAELPGVQVLVGELDDLPLEASYDVVLVVGVLEYVGAGTDQLRPYREFLDGIAARLVEGGTLVLMIENQLGVKYLAGAPEDHTARVWDSIEGYPRGGRARTFSREQLESLIRDSGLDPKTRVAFPDYKITRTVLGDVPAPYRSLLHRIPLFPSPDWAKPRPRIGSEAALWRQLVEAGVDRDFGNSFVVVASKGAPDADRFWPSQRLGVYFSTNRRRELEVRTDVELVADGVRFRRTRRSAQRAGERVDGLHVVASDSSYAAGTDLIDLVARDGIPAFARYAERWLAVLDAALASDPGSAVDALPHNIVVDDDDRLQPIDVEFSGVLMTRDQLVRRAIFTFAGRLVEMAAPERLAPALTTRDVMVELGKIVGLDADGDWIATTIEDEIAFLFELRPIPPGVDGEAQWRDSVRRRLQRGVDQQLRSTALGEHVWDEHYAAHVERLRLREQKGELAVVIHELKEALSQARARARRAEAARAKAQAAAKAQQRAMANLPEVRVGRKVRTLAARVLPRGTQRRRTVRAVARRLIPRG